MESYHLPVCHAGTIGGLSELNEMICPPGRQAFNYRTILKDDTLKIALAHPNNTRLQGDRRRRTFLLAVYPSLLVTLTPGYFWYLRCSRSRRAGMPTWTMATISGKCRRKRASLRLSTSPGFVPPYIRPLFCRGVGPFR
jgi:hypothetical protein